MVLGAASPAGVGFVEGFESPGLECVFCPFLVLDVEPHPQSMLVLRCMIFVSSTASRLILQVFVVDLP